MSYSNEPDDIRRFDNDPRSPYYEEWVCPGCGETNTDCELDHCVNELEGWAIDTSSTPGTKGRDMLKFGFKLEGDLLYPDDIQAIRERLKGVYRVVDVTPDYKPGQERHSRSVKLCKITHATQVTGGG